MIIAAPMSSRFGIISHVNKRLLEILAGLGLLAVSGCFSFESTPIGGGTADGLRIHATDGDPVEHVVVANNGWYLFNLWPLASGNAAVDAKFPWRFFRNDVHERIMHDRMTRYAAGKSCDIEEMNVFNDEQVLLSIPGTSFPLPIPYVFTFRELQVSGVLVKRTHQSSERAEAKRRKAITREMKRLLDALPDGGQP